MNYQTEVIQLANGSDVPVYLVKALEEFDKAWPGATLPQARAGIVDAILKAQKNRGKK